jgi:hypothetical protein
VHLDFLFFLGCLVSLSAESIHAPVTARDIMRVEIVQVPSQTSEQVLARLKQYVHLVAVTLRQVIYILLYIPRRVTSSDDGHLSLEKQRQSLFPLVHRGCVAKTGVEDDEAIEIRIVWVEVAGLVDVVVMFNESADLHGIGNAIFDDGAEGIERCAFRQRKFVLAVCHSFGANEVEGELDTVEEVSQLHPGLTRKRRLSTCTENEEADRRGSNAGVLPCVTTTASWGVESVSQSCIDVSALQL